MTQEQRAHPEWRKPKLKGTRKTQVETLGQYRVGKRARMRASRGIPGTVPIEMVAPHVDRLRGWGFNDYAISAAAGINQKTVWNVRHRKNASVTLEHALRIRSVTHTPVPLQSGLRIPNIGTARRIRALCAIGWTYETIGEQLGVTYRRICEYHKHQFVYYETWAAIKRLYDELSGTPGPSRFGEKRARRRGLASPLQWSGLDIDNPEHEPDIGDRNEAATVDDVLLRRILVGHHREPVPPGPERTAVLEIAFQNGWSGKHIARLLNLKETTGDQLMVRYRHKQRKAAA